MKKQFFRVKQLADQTFSRAGKTEALSEDLLIVEKRIEFLNKACQNISKKISTTLLGQGQENVTKEKKLRKSVEYLLAMVLLECNTGDVDDTLKNILEETCKIQQRLAEASIDTDTRIETSVVIPLQQIIEHDIPNIMKQKRNLTKLILDMDSAKNRYHAASKHVSNSTSTGGNNTKVDSIKEELEDLETKVEQCRDALACDMFQLLSKEAVLADVLLEYIKLQQAAHRAALTILDEMVPELQSSIENNNLKPVFGWPLEDHLRITNRKIAYPLELCVCVLLEFGLEEEGLFRMAGGTSKIRRLKYGLDANFISMETALEFRDVHVISSVLKSYFRELPEPLLTYALYDEWLAAIKYSDDNAKLPALWSVLSKLPSANYDNLRYLIKFLALLTKNHELNKMTPQNLAIVIAPNLIWSHNNSNPTIGENMNLANQYSTIVEYLVKYAEWFFPGDEAFYITVEEASTRTKRHARSNSADMRLLNADYVPPSESNSMKRCQSTTSLEEQIQNCPLPESPKPITRTRKNKPAPIPPSLSHDNCLSSLGTAASKDKVSFNAVKSNSASQLLKNQPSNESPPPVDNVSVGYQDVFTFKEVSEKLDESYDEEKEEKSNFKSPKLKSHSDDVHITISQDISKLLPPESLNKILESKKSAKPVPAPRISLEVLNRSTEDSSPRKPVIPEKPTILPRPMSGSFKTFKSSDLVEGNKCDVEKSKGPSLEKAHLYSVDKQQVSFIEIPSTGNDASTNESNHNHSIIRSRPSFSLGDKIICDKQNKQEGLHKSEVSPDSGQISSHTRALSEGHNIEISNSVNLPPHRSFHRVQRPIPPPPPPPVVTKSQSRSGSVGDSTNL